MNLNEVDHTNFIEIHDLQDYDFLPKTSRYKTTEEAVRIAKLANASGLCHMVKVEIIGCDKTLLPDPLEPLRATEQSLEEGLTVLTYTSDDVVLARRLEDIGAHAI